MKRHCCFILLHAALVSLCGCAGLSHPPRHPLITARTIVSQGKTGNNIVLSLPDGEQLAAEDVSFTSGALRTLIYRGKRETWFQTALRQTTRNSRGRILHNARFDTSRIRDLHKAYYVCRGWVGFTGPVPKGYQIEIKEIVSHGANTRPLVSRRLVAKSTQTGQLFLELIPLNQRVISLIGVETNTILDVKYEIGFSGGDGEVDAEISLSPQFLTDKDWRDEVTAQKNVARLLNLDNSRPMQLFAELFVNTASGYVMAHLPTFKRVHCFLQADLTRDWYRQVIAQYPEIHRTIRLTGLRRTPRWQSSNMVTIRTNRTALSYLRKNDGIVLDTWRANGATETKIQTMREFKKILSYVYLEETVGE